MYASPSSTACGSEGGEAAGAYTTPVAYQIRGTTEMTNHTSRAVFPTFLTLRWVGAPASGSATLGFEYLNAASAFMSAVSTGTPLAPTSADFERLEISTNHPAGYTVAVVVVPLEAPLGSVSLARRLTLGGVPVEQRQYVSTGPTNGFTTLATPADFGLLVDGSEVPGAYYVELRYVATRNP